MSFLLHNPMIRPLGDNGEILPGCYAQLYQSQTTTPTPGYADAGLTTPLSNPVVADSAGRLQAIYGDSAVVYRMQLYDANDVLLLDIDPVHPHSSVPPGTIVFFRGDATARDAAYPPVLFEVCDGDNGTIDFTGRSPVGAGTGFAVGDTGGSSGNVTSGSGGSVAEGVTGSTTLAANQIPAHQHFTLANVIQVSDTAPSASNYVAGETTVGGDTEYDMQGTATAATVGLTSSAGGGEGHTHTVPAISAHTHTVNVPRSPYGVVWMLERKA